MYPKKIDVDGKSTIVNLMGKDTPITIQDLLKMNAEQLESFLQHPQNAELRSMVIELIAVLKQIMKSHGVTGLPDLLKQKT